MFKRLVLELDEETHMRVKVKAARENKSMREVFSSIINQWLNDSSDQIKVKIKKDK